MVNGCTGTEWIMVWKMGDMLYIWDMGNDDRLTCIRSAFYSSSVEKAASWLEHLRHEDGGWGESCQSSVEKKFISLPFSTPSQTAWALDALISYYDQETPIIRKGISYLLAQSTMNEKYPTGTGLPGAFIFAIIVMDIYIRYLL